MIFRNRVLAGVGAAALLVAGVFAAGAPAYAAGTETDLELTVVGTKVAAGTEGKIAWAKIANKGANTPRELRIAADLSALDLDKVVVLPAADCELSDPPVFVITCDIEASEIPGPGETLEVPVVVVKSESSELPYSGAVKFTISSPDDTTPGNNSQTANVVLSEESGVDIGVWVPDVKERLSLELAESDGLLRAGDTTLVFGWIYNSGDVIANGLKVTVRLPEHVTFADVEQDCQYSADNRIATCIYKSMVLLPIDVGGEGDDDLVGFFHWPITVDAEVEGPVTLTDGSWTVEALGQAPVDSPLARSAGANLPENVKMVSAKDAGVTEIDESDNVDGFAVVVTGEGGGGGGGGLPVTGVQAGLLGGIGLAVVVAGGVMFLLARRRKVVLVTPGDEKPTV